MTNETACVVVAVDDDFVAAAVVVPVVGPNYPVAVEEIGVSLPILIDTINCKGIW